jgi:hypothetical protein
MAGITPPWLDDQEGVTVRLRSIMLAAVAILVVAAPAAALASQTYSDTSSGYEYYFTSTDGRFAGTASGALRGAWNANVQHTKLCLSCTPTATITGGGFQLATSLHGTPSLVTGSFTGGTVQVIHKGVSCTNQTFAVHGLLGSVGPYGGHGTGTFNATLTHHRTSILGTCITYAASVSGTIDLTF